MRSSAGVTFIELLIVVFISGVVLGLGVLTIRPDRTAVNQAAQILASEVNRVRFEAIRTNRTAGMALLTTGDGGYTLCVDENSDLSCGSDEIFRSVTFGQGDFSKVRLAAVSGIGNNAIIFDRRGVARGQITGAITLASRSSSYTRTIRVSATGRTQIQ